MSTDIPGAGDAGQPPAQPPKAPIVPKSASEALRPEAGTPPPGKRSRRSRSQVVVFLNFVMTIVILVVLIGAGAVYFGKRQFEGRGPSQVASTFLVKQGAGVSEVASLLERRGLVSDARIFRVGVRAYGNDQALKAGEYEIKPGASMLEIMELLKSGKSVLYSLTIPEGLTVEQAFQRIAENEALSGEMPTEIPPEGSLATDTQRFTRGASRRQIIDKMLAHQKALVEEIWERRSPDLPVKDINEFVTLASIVEKETGKSDERPHVASVFINRLNKNMRLQSDPTILYGLFGGKGRPADRPIYQSDIQKPTPYNTYTINGLPPTPIANPGRASLEAVANPSKTKDLYFVADGTGGHVFAETLEEHNRNVAQWRAVQKKQREEAAKVGNALPDDAELPVQQ
ncbi:endolytic transglycosylase MltG [Corticibacterium sp. UT-5YL-CI-8]|nr:endolytic transglycosylase MltG [Tianweitania sp. UT-5YL-CI-8]